MSAPPDAIFVVHNDAPAEARAQGLLNNGMERDHGHLKQRLYPMRRFKQAGCAGVIARGYAIIQHLRNGFSELIVGIPRVLRLATAWPQLAQAISHLSPH